MGPLPCERGRLPLPAPCSRAVPRKPGRGPGCARRSSSVGRLRRSPLAGRRARGERQARAGEAKLLANERGREAAVAGEPCRSSQPRLSRGAPRPVPHSGAPPRAACPAQPGAGGQATPPRRWPGSAHRAGGAPRRRPAAGSGPHGKMDPGAPGGAGARGAIGRRLRFDTESCARVGGPR